MLRILKRVMIKGLIYSAIACIVGVVFALIKKTPITLNLLASANLLFFFGSLVVAIIIGGSNHTSRLDLKSPNTRATMLQDVDITQFEDNMFIGIMIAASGFVPLIVWAVLMYGLQ